MCKCIETALPGSKCNNIFADCKTCLAAHLSKIPQCMKTRRHSRFCSKVVAQRVRNRKLSRIPSKKVIQSLKFRKLRQKHRKMLHQTVPVSSVLHAIAANNYKLWKSRCIWREDSLYSYYFKSHRHSRFCSKVVA